jgi:hypothetical protein
MQPRLPRQRRCLPILQFGQCWDRPSCKYAPTVSRIKSESTALFKGAHYPTLGSLKNTLIRIAFLRERGLRKGPPGCEAGGLVVVLWSAFLRCYRLNRLA